MFKKFKNTLVGERITLEKLEPEFKLAQVIFEVIDANREHLSAWLPWPKFILKPEDQLKYIFTCEEECARGEKIDYGIYLGHEYIGNISMFEISQSKLSGEIGYWLSAKYAGNGYMTEAVKLLEKDFFESYGLNRLVIKCDENNLVSAKVARKCGYHLDGIMRQDSRSIKSDELRNSMVFSKLKAEYQ